MKIKILIPIYNDWQSAIELLKNIDSNVANLQYNFSVILIDDASIDPKPEIKVDFKNILSIKIITMKENRGHARCNAAGLKYIYENEDFDYVIPMDGDGEDRPEEIKYLFNKAMEDQEVSVVAKRVKRSEGPVFQILYEIHKLITLLFSGKQVNFGNYSCLTKKDVITLSQQESLWSSFSGTVKKSILRLNTCLLYTSPSPRDS